MMSDGNRGTFTIFVVAASLVLALGGVISTLIMYAEYARLRSGTVPVIKDEAPSKNYLEKMNSETASLRSRLAAAETAAAKLTASSQSALDNMAVYAKRIDDLEAERGELEKTVAEKEKLVLELRGTLKNVSADYDKRIEELKGSLAAEQKRSSILESEKKRIEDDAANRVKKAALLLEEKERVIKIIGDLLLVKEQEISALKLELHKLRRFIGDKDAQGGSAGGNK